MASTVEDKTKLDGVHISFAGSTDSGEDSGFTTHCEKPYTWVITVESAIHTSSAIIVDDKNHFRGFFDNLVKAKNLKQGKNWLIHKVEAKCHETHCSARIESTYTQN